MSGSDDVFAVRVREAMDERRISVQDLAKRMGASRHTVLSWIYGRRKPRQIKKLATVLRTSVGSLYGEQA